MSPQKVLQEMMFSCHSFLDFCSDKFLQCYNMILWEGQCSQPQSPWFFFPTVSAGVLYIHVWIEEKKSLSHVFLCSSDAWSSAFQSGVNYFILVLYPWALDSIGCRYNTRSYDSAFFFSLGIHSTFLGSRITHFLPLFEHLPEAIGAISNGLVPRPHCQACILEIDMPRILG